MSLQQAAKYLQSKGRGEDSVLIHMTPGEVKSLQAVAMAHGGSLTINPETGLPEAGFLDKLMPMIVGAGLAAATGGTSLALTPGMIGLGVGGLETLRTGNLGKGLMAGLGAYGGAGLGAGLMASGADQAARSVAAGGAEEAANAALQSQSNPMSTMGQGVMNLGEQSGRQSFMNAVGGGKGLALSGLAAAAPVLMGDQQGLPPMQNKGGPNPYNYKYESGTANPQPAPDVPEYGNLGQDFGRQRSFYPGARYVPMNQEGLSRMAGGGIADAFPPGQSVLYAAEGGQMSHLGDYSDGGRLLRGPGDGVSDSIPAVIGDKQPARLADGEFVVPARIVSELGNGSTEAGARKLYAMMDRVQKARSKTVGKGNVAKNSRADKHLPA